MAHNRSSPRGRHSSASPHGGLSSASGHAGHPYGSAASDDVDMILDGGSIDSAHQHRAAAMLALVDKAFRPRQRPPPAQPGAAYSGPAFPGLIDTGPGPGHAQSRSASTSLAVTGGSSHASSASSVRPGPATPGFPDRHSDTVRGTGGRLARGRPEDPTGPAHARPAVYRAAQALQEMSQATGAERRQALVAIHSVMTPQRQQHNRNGEHRRR